MRQAIIAAALLLAVGASAAGPGTNGASPRTIRWVLAHTAADPTYKPLFDDFAKRVQKRSAGGLKIEYVDAGVAGDHNDAEAQKLLLQDRADIGQFERDFVQYVPAVTAPFAFRDYAHAEAVFEGPVGQKLLARLYDSTDRKLRAVAFTYSGGRRVLIGRKPVATVADLAGQRMESPGNAGWTPLLDDFFKGAGVTLVPAKDSGQADVDQREDAVNRIAFEMSRHPQVAKELKYLNLTYHGMLVTAVVANEQFLSGLPKDQRAALLAEVAALARRERTLSIHLEAQRLKALRAKGLKVLEMPEAERRKLFDVSEAALKKHPDIARDVNEIRAVKVDQKTAKL